MQNGRPLPLFKEAGTAPWQSLILPGNLLTGRRPSRPKEDTRHWGDDSARNQAATSVVPGHGDIHGKFHTPSKPSHGAAETVVEERCHVLLGWPAYSVLSGNQTPFKEADIKAAWILRSEERSDCPGRCFSKGTGHLSHTGWQTNSLCQQVTDRSGEPLCQHRERTARPRLCMHTVQHLSSRAQVHSSVRP